MPATIRGMFSGTLRAYQTSLASEPYLIMTALWPSTSSSESCTKVIFIRSQFFPLCLPPAWAPWLRSSLPPGPQHHRADRHLLLIGIVKKNAILMIDFALAAERTEGKSSRDAIFPSMLAAFPPNPDDHHGRAVRSIAVGSRNRHRLGAPKPARRHHYWRI